MKVLAVFSLVLAVATSYPVVKTWTYRMLLDAAYKMDLPELEPGDPRWYLVDAMQLLMTVEWENQINQTMEAEQRAKLYRVVVPSPTGAATWTVEQLKAALADPALSEEPVLLDAKHLLGRMRAKGNLQDTLEVEIRAADISTWTPEELIEALKSPTTKPALIPYLEKAYVELKEALDNGQTREFVHVVTPVGLVPSTKPDYDYLSKPLKDLIMPNKKRI